VGQDANYYNPEAHDFFKNAVFKKNNNEPNYNTPNNPNTIQQLVLTF